MTTATVAPATVTQFAVLLAMTLLIGFIFGVILWRNEGHDDKQDDKLNGHDEQLARLTYRLESLLEYLGLEVPEPVEDDSPAAEALQVYGGLAATDKPDDDSPAAELLTTNTVTSKLVPDEYPTDEIPTAPPTVPDGMPLAVQSALIEARDLSDERPHPVDSAERKAKNAADIEEALKRFTFTGGRK